MKLVMKIVCAVIGMVLVMGAAGTGLCILVNNAIENKYEVYTSAIQAETPEEFRRAIDNRQNVIATDKLVANELVSHDELEGEYAYISVSHRQKIMKTRVVTYVQNGKTKTRSEIYYDWQYFGEKSYHGESFSFMGYEFSYDEVDLPERHMKDVDYDGYKQDTYYVVENNVVGTMFVSFDNDKISTTFYDDTTIAEAIDKSDDKTALIVTAVICGLATIGLCIWVGNKVWWECE